MVFFCPTVDLFTAATLGTTELKVTVTERWPLCGSSLNWTNVFLQRNSLSRGLIEDWERLSKVYLLNFLMLVSVVYSFYSRGARFLLTSLFVSLSLFFSLWPKHWARRSEDSWITLKQSVSCLFLGMFLRFQRHVGWNKETFRFYPDLAYWNAVTGCFLRSISYV